MRANGIREESILLVEASVSRTLAYLRFLDTARVEESKSTQKP